MMSTVEGIADVIVNQLSWIDYVIFLSVLMVSAAIGIFYGCFGGKNRTSDEFLVAKGTMQSFPVAMSLIVSFMSAIGFIGIPADVYQNGITYLNFCLAHLFAIPTVAYVYLPVFWSLKVTSANAYLEKRFNKGARILASFLFIFQMSFYLAIGVYAPALALAHVTSLNVYLSICLICIVCIFYTTLGGIKAVIWTDALQGIILYGSMFFILIQGTIEQGGFNNVIEAAKRGGRDNLFVFDLSLSKTYTFWNLSIGGYFTVLAVFGTNQIQIQRYMSLPRKSTIIKVLWCNMLGMLLMTALYVFAGLILFAKYENCDPISSHLIVKSDQILPYYVMNTLGSFKGIPGLFIAGVFSASLSTISSGINSLAAIALEDLAKGIFPNMKERTAATTSKVLNFYFGVQIFALTFAAEKLSSVFQATVALFGILGGSLLGLFSLGMLVPMANATGAIGGTLISTAIMLWIGMGSYVARVTGTLVSTETPLPLTACSNITSAVFSNSSLTQQTVYTNSSAYNLPLLEHPTYDLLNEVYSISFMWYGAMGFIITMVIGCLLSFLTGGNDKRSLNIKLLSPFVTWFSFLYPGYETIGINYIEDHFELKKSETEDRTKNKQINLAYDITS